MKTYNFKLKVEGSDSIVNTTERANNAEEAQQKVLERYGRLYKGKTISIISINPPQ